MASELKYVSKLVESDGKWQPVDYEVAFEDEFNLFVKDEEE